MTLRSCSLCWGVLVLVLQLHSTILSHTGLCVACSLSDTLPPLPTLAATAGPGEHARICLVSSEFAGVVPNGGIGTFYSALAEALATRGHNVTLLYTQGTRSHHAEHGFAHWQHHYGARNVSLLPLPAARPLHAGYHSAVAYQVYHWLQTQHFDVVHFPDWQGYGYHALLAKQLRLHFQDTTLAVMTHGPLRWARASGGEALNTPDDLEADFLEQESVRLADVLVSPSRYLLRWMDGQGWALPQHGRVHVQPYIMPQAAHDVVRAAAQAAAADNACAGGAAPSSASTADVQQPLPVEELVFFGRLEVRKGVVLFCDAVDALLARHVAALPPGGLRITFLGSDRSSVLGANSSEYVRDRAAAWRPRVRVELLTNKDTLGALGYLLGPRRAAVLPSLVENAPLAILELIGARVPFVASTAGGIPEEVAPEWRPRVLFEPTLPALTAKLVEVLTHGAHSPAAAFDTQQNEARWVAWHQAAAAVHQARQAAGGSGSSVSGRGEAAAACGLGFSQGAAPGCLSSASEASGEGGKHVGAGVAAARGLQQAGADLPASGAAPPMVDICIAARAGDPAAQDTLLSALSQRYGAAGAAGSHVDTPSITVAVAGPSSQSESGTADSVKDYPSQALPPHALTAAGRVRWLPLPGAASLAAAHNPAASNATGEYTLFMAAGVQLLPDALAALVQTATITNADAVSGTLCISTPDQAPGSSRQPCTAVEEMHPFLGPAIGPGAFSNVLGGLPLLVRQAAYKQLGGFNASLAEGYEHWELLLRAALAGMRVAAHPLPVAWAPLPGGATWNPVHWGGAPAQAALAPLLAFTHRRPAGAAGDAQSDGDTQQGSCVNPAGAGDAMLADGGKTGAPRTLENSASPEAGESKRACGAQDVPGSGGSTGASAAAAVGSVTKAQQQQLADAWRVADYVYSWLQWQGLQSRDAT